MCKKLPVGKFKWSKNLSKNTEHTIKNYDDNNDYSALLEVDPEYTIHKSHYDIPFSPERRKINKIEKVATTLEDKEKYVVHTSALKQALNHGIKLQKVHRVITSREEARLKPYIDMNTELRGDVANHFEKDFLKLVNKSVFG